MENGERSISDYVRGYFHADDWKKMRYAASCALSRGGGIHPAPPGKNGRPARLVAETLRCNALSRWNCTNGCVDSD